MRADGLTSSGYLGRYIRSKAMQRLDGITDAGICLFEGEQAQFLGDKEAALQATVQVNDQRFWRLMASGGSLGVGESWMLGLWDSPDLTKVIRVFARNREVLSKLGKRAWWQKILLNWWHINNRNSVAGSKRNIAAHYDLSNDFFQLWLDQSMLYSSAIFTEPEQSLEQAQVNKVDRICRELKLKKGDKILEIGTGWGGFAIHAASEYGCDVTTTTISQAQHDYALERIKEAGLDDSITLLMKDYRDLSGTYDAVVSIEMIEAVGHQFVDQYFEIVQQRLRPGGQAMIQAITIEDHRYEQALHGVDFIKRYIFPGSFIPSLQRLQQAWGKTNLVLKDTHAIGQSYALTLATWGARFNDQLESVEAMGFDQQFIRMWIYYLCFCEGGFTEGALDDLQIHLYKPET